MTTNPKYNLNGHHQALSVTNPYDMPPLADYLDAIKCEYQQLWENAVPPMSPDSYQVMLEAAAKPPPVAGPRIPNTPVFKDFTAVQMLEKVHEYVKAGWRRGDLGDWTSPHGIICLMGGVYRFLAREVLNAGHTVTGRAFGEAAERCKPLLDGLRSFAMVIKEQHPEMHNSLPIKELPLQNLSSFIISYNDSVAHGAEAVCALLEKAMVRELERV